jgi:hypothetical protein
MRFGGAQDDAPADVGEGAADVNAAAVEVNVADAQGGCLARTGRGPSSATCGRTRGF